MSQQKLVDYSNAFPDALIAQGSGGNFLALYRRDSPATRADGKKASYELDYRWLSQECEEETDQSWACVQGAEVTYWQRKELDKLIRKMERGDEVNLFDHFNLL